MLVPNVFISLIFGAASAYIARTRGKNPYLWFFLGALFGLIGLLFLFFDSRPSQAKKGRQDPNIIDVTPQYDPSCKEKLWYYLDSTNQQQGPMSFDALLKAYSEQKITRSSYIWSADLDSWKLFSDIVQ